MDHINGPHSLTIFMDHIHEPHSWTTFVDHIDKIDNIDMSTQGKLGKLARGQDPDAIWSFQKYILRSFVNHYLFEWPISKETVTKAGADATLNRRCRTSSRQELADAGVDPIGQIEATEACSAAPETSGSQQNDLELSGQTKNS